MNNNNNNKITAAPRAAGSRRIRYWVLAGVLAVLLAAAAHFVSVGTIHGELFASVHAGSHLCLAGIAPHPKWFTCLSIP